MTNIVILIIGSPALFAAVDTERVPAAYCRSAEELISPARQCGENHFLSAGAESCLEKIEGLERELGRDALEIARTGRGGQRAQAGAGDEEYQFSQRAMEHLIRVAGLALRETERYPLFLLAPDDFYNPAVTGADPVAWQRKLACHGGVERRIELVRARLQAKVRHFQDRRNEAAAHRGKLRRQLTVYSALGRSAGGENGAGAAVGGRVPAEAPAAGSSTITGKIRKDRSD